MAFNKRTWKGRQGTGLNKFSIGGATPVTVVNQPDSVTEQGDALSAGNMNDLEDRIESGFDDVDTALATKADQTEVTDLKNACSALDKRVTNLELKTGDQFDVDYPSDTYGMDGVPANVAQYAEVTKLRGVSRASNQLAKELNSTNWQFNNATGSFSDGVATFTATAYRGNIGMNSNDRTLPNVAGRVVLISVDVKTTTATTSVRLYAYGGYAVRSCVSSTNWQTISHVVTTDASWGYDLTGNNRATVEDARSGSWDAIQVKNWVVTDLNVGFNTNDLSFLGANDNAKLATIQQNYPWLLTPSDYGTSMVKTRYEGFVSKSRNLWNQTWEVGRYDPTTGQKQDGPTTIRSAGFIPIVPSTSYYLKSPISGAENCAVFYYDINKNFLSLVGNNNVAKQAPSNAYYVTFFMASAYGTTYNGDICFNKSDSQDGTFTPFFESTLSLPTPIELGSAGSVAEEAYLNEDGEAWRTNPIGSYTFTGNENFYYSSGRFIWEEFSTTGAKAPSSSSVEANATMAIYILTTADNTTSSSYDKSFGISLYKALCIRDSAYDSSTLNSFKSYLTGKTIYFELATPDADTLLTPILDPFIEVEGGGTIKPVQSQSPEVDSAMTIEYMAS